MGERLFGGMYTEIRRSLITEILKVERPEQVEAVLESFNFEADVYENFERFYVRTGTAFAKDTVDKYKSIRLPMETKDEDLWMQEIMEFVRTETGMKISSITRAHYDDIVRVSRTVVEQAITQGWGIEKMARTISKDVGVMDLWKARRIARTEVVTASNYGVQVGADDLPGTKEKVWISTFDARSREDHMAMDGQRVGYMDKFDVAGHMMDWPGDTSAPPEQVINCRCGWDVIIKSDIYE